jgi:hypothetical protein
MKYYNFDLSWDPKIIGVRNGVSQGNINPKKYKNKSNWDIYNDWFYYERPNVGLDRKYFIEKGRFELKPEEFVVENFTFMKSAKLTDFISHSPATFFSCPFMVNSKARKFLESLNLPLHKFYSVENVVYKEQKLDNLYLFCFPSLPLDCFNWNDSVFFKGEILNPSFVEIKHKTLKFENFKSFQSREDRIINELRIVYNKDKILNYDIFKDPVSSNHLVSERFKEMYEKEGLTGADIYKSEFTTYEFK